MHAISASPTESGSACCASGTEMKIEYATAAAGAMCVIDWNSTCGSPIECSRRWSNPRAALVAPSIAILLKYGEPRKAGLSQTRRRESWRASARSAHGERLCRQRLPGLEQGLQVRHDRRPAARDPLPHLGALREPVVHDRQPHLRPEVLDL